MRFNDLFPSNYLKKDDVTSPITTHIKAVNMAELDGDHGKESKPVISFQGCKDMVLNKGNGTVLYEAYGEPENWPGKPVEIFVDPNVMFGGKRTGGLRLRVPANGVSSGAMTVDQALAACAVHKIDRAALIAALKAQGRAGWQPSRDTPFVREMIKRAQEDQPEQGFEDVPSGVVDGGEIPF